MFSDRGSTPLGSTIPSCLTGLERVLYGNSVFTRAEVVAIVNRVTDREADTEYVNKNLTSLNRFKDLTDKGYWAYYDITEAANTHKAVTNADGETWVK